MQRKKLWELDSRFHCLTIGTALTVGELRGLARKAGMAIDADDYALHHSVVQAVGEPIFIARAIHKFLDRKFTAVLRRFSACRDDDALGRMWDEATAHGDIAGALWALITHPCTSVALMQRVYGEMHMLSHVAGHSHRSTQKQMAVLRQRIAELEEKQAWTAEASRVRINALEAAAAALSERAQRADRSQQELALVRVQLARLESGTRLAQLQAENDALSAQLRHAVARADRAEHEAHEWMQLALEPARDAPPADTTDRPHAPPASEVRCSSTCDAASDECYRPDLCGRRVLYVGGRNRQVAHFRNLVARRNGELLHHDGGLSENTARLAALIGRVDAVLCPIDCVSHDACLQVKHFCKRAAKRFVPLRSASLAGFMEGLRAVSPHAPSPD